MPDLCCSFCRKPQDGVGKLISNPGDYSRAYICAECIAVCHSILADERSEELPAPEPSVSAHPLLSHPLASEMMDHLVQWIRKESLGADASDEFARVHETASKMTGGR